MFAARGGYDMVIDELVQAGAEVNTVSKAGETAFKIAADNNNNDAAVALIEGGAPAICFTEPSAVAHFVLQLCMKKGVAGADSALKLAAVAKKQAFSERRVGMDYITSERLHSVSVHLQLAVRGVIDMDKENSAMVYHKLIDRACRHKLKPFLAHPAVHV